MVESARLMTTRTDDWLFGLALATAATTLVSITAAQSLLALTILVWIALRPRRPVWPGFTLPMFAFMAITLISLAASTDPSVGRGPVLKFVLFSMALVAASFVTTTARLKLLAQALTIVAAVAATAGLAQFASSYLQFSATQAMADDPTLLDRSTGFMGHWMTYSGEQMLVWTGVLPLLWGLGVGRVRFVAILIAAGLVFSFTRSVWIGAALGATVAALYLPFRQVVRVLAPVLMIGLVALPLIWHRIAASFMEGGFAPDRGRIEMLQVGWGMVRDHPLFGVGPERVGTEFERYYQGEHIEDLYTGHLHSNIVQIAAERGLPAAAILVWLLLKIGIDMVRGARSSDPGVKWSSVSGLAVLVAFVAAGMFEFNFGDSEVLMLFVFLVSVPYGMRSGAELGR